MRQFIRHPCSIPIEIVESESSSKNNDLNNISEGGLAFESYISPAKGAHISVKIPLSGVEEQFDGRVVWSRMIAEDRYEIGVQFVGEEHTRLRMIEQICYITEYGESQKRLGRDLNSEEAAIEWIEKYAHEFPR